ncbi:uncharacterized protein LOC134686090 [Mytilus trossulus]|uniref:uncharacterized protein LOC134686090 n=1 Tax=Mytilus trossulus TaxID=6551 RepID=UPI00300698D4
MERICSGIDKDDHCKYPDAQQKSYFQKLMGLFTLSKIYGHAEVKITQGGELFDVSFYQDSEGRYHLEITYPLNWVLESLNTTPYRTKLRIINEGRTEHSKIENRVFNSQSDIQHEQYSCSTEIDRTKRHNSIKNKICTMKSHLKPANEFCSPKRDDPDLTTFDNQLMYKYNVISEEDECSLSEEQSDVEYENPRFRGSSVILKSHSIKKFDINDHSGLVESVMFTKENSFGQTDPFLMFSLGCGFYTPHALINSNMVDSEIGNSFKIFYISATKTELLILLFTPIRKFTAFQIANTILNRIDCRDVRSTTAFLELISQTDKENDCESVRSEKEEEVNYACDSLDPNDIIEKTKTQFDQSESHKNIRQTNYKKLGKIDINSKQIHYKSIDNCKSNYVGKNSHTKDFTHSIGVHRTKTGNHKLKTQGQTHATWKITIIRGEEQIVDSYLGDSMVRQAMYEFFGENDYIRYKASFERPNVPWPSMHPLLPYKYRFLDNCGS